MNEVKHIRPMKVKNYFRKSPMERMIIPKLPEKCERLIKKICGQDWRQYSNTEIEGALGVAIVLMAIDEETIEFNVIARRIGIDVNLISIPFERLARNGYMNKKRLWEDKQLVDENLHAWCYVAGTASGVTGNVIM